MSKNAQNQPAAAQRQVPLAQREFASFAELIRENAAWRPEHPALILGQAVLSYAALHAMMDRAAAALQRDGFIKGETIAFAAGTSINYLAAMLGALRAGLCVVPLAVSSTPAGLAGLIRDSSARLLFLDAGAAAVLSLAGDQLADVGRIYFDGGAGIAFQDWLAPEDVLPAPVEMAPDDPFNIIYSSGTTGRPKGIVQSHGMRWQYVRFVGSASYNPDSGLLISTPFYSNTTLASLFPALARGATIVLMEKFDARRFLELAERHRVTDTMLVPVQVQRIMAVADFDRFDLSSFKMKSCASAPFAPALKADVLKRWPGGLIEFYGMTEGGGACRLIAHQHPDKLHTVGQPVPGHDIRIIDDEGRALPAGRDGEIVGRSGQMMAGYRNQPEIFAAAIWMSPDGLAFIRTGDIGRFDEDGFLQIIDRKKDMIISGGFNIYPSDIETILGAHEAVAEVAVVGVPSAAWGETPVAFVVPHKPGGIDAVALREWVNSQVGRTQRLSDLVVLEALPRSGVGKILKGDLRAMYGATSH